MQGKENYCVKVLEDIHLCVQEFILAGTGRAGQGSDKEDK